MDDDEVERRVAARIEEVLTKQASVLKARYREQALKAVADTEAKGKENLLSTVSALQDQIDTLTKKLQNSQEEILLLNKKLADDSRANARAGTSVVTPVVNTEVTREQLEAAFEKGKSTAAESLKAAEVDAKCYKAALQMLQTNSRSGRSGLDAVEDRGASDEDANGSKLLVKSIMEAVYRDVKKEFSQGSTAQSQAIEERVVIRMRDVLTASASTLSSKLGALALVHKDQLLELDATVERQEKQILLLQKQIQKQAQRRGSAGDATDALPVMPMRRAQLLYITSRARPIQQYINVSIDKYSYTKVKGGGLLGAFKGSVEVVMYTIATSIVQRKSNIPDMIAPFDESKVIHTLKERRFKEFKALYSQLRKEFPLVIIPHVPDVELVAKWTPVTQWHYRRSKSEAAEWTMEGNATASQPTSAINASPNAGANTGDDGDDNSGGSLRLETRRRLLMLWLQYLCHHSVLQQSNTLTTFVLGNPSATGSLARVTPDARRTMLLLSPPPVHPQEQQHKTTSIDHALELSLKDINTLKKDVRLMDGALTDLGETTRELADYRSARADQEWKFADLISSYIQAEQHGGVSNIACLYSTDTLYWQVVGRALSCLPSFAPPIFQFLHQLKFLATVNASAATQFDHNIAIAAKSSGAAALLMNTRSSNNPSLQGIPAGIEFASNDTDEDSRARLALAIGTAEDWDSMRRQRIIHMTHALYDTAAKMRTVHSEALTWWEQARAELQAVDRQVETNPDPKMNNIKAPRDMLVKDCRMLGSHFDNIRQEYQTKKSMQNEFVNIRNRFAGKSASDDTGGSFKDDHTYSDVLSSGANLDPLKSFEDSGSEAHRMPHVQRFTEPVPSFASASDPQQRPALRPPLATGYPASNDTYTTALLNRPLVPPAARKEPTVRKTAAHTREPTTITPISEPANSRPRKSSMEQRERVESSVFDEPERKSQGTGVAHTRGRGYSDLWADAEPTDPSISTVSSALSRAPSSASAKVGVIDADMESSQSSKSGRLGALWSAAGSLFGGSSSKQVSSSGTSSGTAGTAQGTDGGGSTHLDGTSWSDSDDAESDGSTHSRSHSPARTAARAAKAIESDLDATSDSTPYHQASRRLHRSDTTKSQAAHAATTDESYDVHEKRLRGRTMRNKSGSTKKTGSAQSVTALSAAMLGGEWGAAPKPASALKAVHAGQSSAMNSYFGQSDTTLPAPLPVVTRPAPQDKSEQSKTKPTVAPTMPMRKGSLDNRTQAAPTPAPTPVPTTAATPAPTSSATPVQATKSTIVQDPTLPDGWEAVRDDQGNTYYYHRVTRVSRWDRPDAAFAASHNERIAETIRDTEERAARRKAELHEVKAAAEAEAAAKQELQAATKSAIMKWAKDPKIMNRNKSIAEMLATVHTLIPSVVPVDGVVADVINSPLTDSSSVSDIKKAFHRAVRYVHPDKISLQVPLETRVLAEGVFVLLTEEFDKFKLVLGI